MKKHSKDPSKNWKQSGIDCSRMIHQDRFWLMVLVASLWNRGPSMNYVASFSWFLSLPSPYHYFFPTVHHQTFLHFSTLPLLTNVDIIFGRPPQLEIANYMKVTEVSKFELATFTDQQFFSLAFLLLCILSFWPLPSNKW